MKTMLIAGAILMLALAGCGPAAPEPEPMTGESAGPVTDSTATLVVPASVAGENLLPTPPPDVAERGMDTPAPDPDAVTRVETPAWFAVPLTEVRTGESFTLDDFTGKVVLVETMAVWCSKCAAQQEQITALHEILGERDDFISVGLDIDPYEDAEVLRSFVDSRGFDWLYAVAPEDVAREIGTLYGSQFLNPPSTPVLIIDRHGEAHLLPFGIKSAEELREALEPFLSEGA